MKTVYLFVPGIMTIPGSAKNWTGRAVTWVNTYTDYKAEKVEYLAGPLRRCWREGDRARKLTSTMQRYSKNNWSVVLVGHSNGADVILDALKLQGFPRVEKLHLISAACENDFEKNGLNITPAGSIYVWIGSLDQAMHWAGTLGGRFLGYGTLGRDGAKNSKVQVHYIREPYGHNEWFRDRYFETTMQRIIGS